MYLWVYNFAFRLPFGILGFKFAHLALQQQLPRHVPVELGLRDQADIEGFRL